MGLGRGAHIAAVPLNGQDSRRAEKTDCAKNQRLRTMPEWWAGCTIRVEFSSVLRESNLLGAYSSAEKALFDVRKESCDPGDAQLAKRSFMAMILAILDFLFGCHHLHLSRVFTLQGETYRVCCDCGARFAYSLARMSIKRRLPLTPVLARFRIA